MPSPESTTLLAPTGVAIGLFVVIVVALAIAGIVAHHLSKRSGGGLENESEDGDGTPNRTEE